MAFWLRYIVALAVGVVCLFLMASLSVMIFKPARPEPFFLAIQFFGVVAGVTIGFGFALRFLFAQIPSLKVWSGIAVIVCVATGAIIYLVMIGFATPKEALFLSLIVVFPLGGFLTKRWATS